MQENGLGSTRDEVGKERAALRELGNYLRQTRESRNMTLSEVVETTKIRSRYLQAIEEGDLSIMPGIVYARGFIRSYADFLGLDGAKLTAQYLAQKEGAMQGNTTDEAVYRSTPNFVAGTARKQSQTVHADRRQGATQVGRKEDRFPWQNKMGILALGVVVLTLIVVITTAMNQPRVTKSAVSVTTTTAHGTAGTTKAKGISKQHVKKSIPTAPKVVLTEVSNTSLSTSFQVASSAPLQLSVTGVSGKCWIQVVGDGQMLVTSAIVTPGQTQSWTAVHSISIDAGASRNISMTINGLPVPLVRSALGGYTYSFVKK